MPATITRLQQLTGNVDVSLLQYSLSIVPDSGINPRMLRHINSWIKKCDY
ncbi:MAG: hypothetical protein OFPI_06980 [Osedax symbiont Rs2]|nr:MAG: hypothetical protein OFPI_06980 [Osedax symbiont Rs2]